MLKITSELYPQFKKHKLSIFHTNNYWNFHSRFIFNNLYWIKCLINIKVKRHFEMIFEYRILLSLRIIFYLTRATRDVTDVTHWQSMLTRVWLILVHYAPKFKILFLFLKENNGAHFFSSEASEAIFVQESEFWQLS